MKKRLQFLIGAAIVGFVLISAYWGRTVDFSFRPWVLGEPVYEGRPFSYWMNHLCTWQDPEAIEARQALEHMGPRAVPYLAAWMTKASKMDRPSYERDYFQRGLEGFQILGPQAAPAIPVLIRGFGHNYGYSEQAILLAGTNAIPYLSQALISTLADTNYPFFQGTLRTGIHKDSGYFVRGCILRIFDQMGTNAEQALPALITTVSTDLPVYNEVLYDENPYTTLAHVGRNHPELVVPVLKKKIGATKREQMKIDDVLATFATSRSG